MAKLRWGANVPSDTSSARQRLIDAAEDCFQRYGVSKTTIEDVAAAAKVSRATVYRYFDDRNELILGVLLREAGRFLGKLQARVDRSESLADAIVDGVLFTVKAVRADANLALLFAPEAAGLTTSIAGASEALFRTTADFLRPLFEGARESGQLREGIDLDEAAEWTLRIVLSLLTVEGARHRTDAQKRELLRTFLVPALVAETPVTAPRAQGRVRANTARR